jgi:hypothetical protein
MFQHQSFGEIASSLSVHGLSQVTRFDQTGPGIQPGWSKLAAGLSLALWFSVGLAGRAIGFLG